jgi:hypothetical protein
MTENNADRPIDPHIAPGQPAREVQPGVNGALFGRMATTTATERTVPEQKDAFRETVETVVFVVVLVLLLKAFMAEAFVIPTGSMATTLLGYHQDIVCPECGFRFPLNTSRFAEEGHRITGCRCPNCELHIDATNSNQFQP